MQARDERNDRSHTGCSFESLENTLSVMQESQRAQGMDVSAEVH